MGSPGPMDWHSGSSDFFHHPKNVPSKTHWVRL